MATNEQLDRNRLRHGGIRQVAYYSLVAILSLLIPVLLYRLWEVNIRVPFAYEKDAIGWGTIVKNFIDGGSFYSYPNYGAPFTGEIGFQPNFNALLLLLLWVMTRFASGYGLILNSAFLLSFPLVGVAAAFVLNRFGVSRMTSLIGALLYTALPYHFYRGIVHLNLSFYYLIPFACWAAYEIIQTKGGLRKRLWNPTYVILCLAFLLLGLSDLYYSFFACILIFAAAVWVAFHEKTPSKFIDMAILVFFCLLGLLISTIAWYVLLKPDSGIAISDSRSLTDLEVYGLKISTLFLPDAHHRLSFLADFAKKYVDSTPNNYESAWATLGIAGVCGFIYMIYAGFIRKIRDEYDQKLRIFAALSVFILLFAVNAGFNIFVGLLVSTAVRCYNRFSVFLAFFILAAFCILLTKVEAAIKHIAARRVFAVVLCAIPILGVLDQTNDSMIPKYKEISQEYFSDQAFGLSISERTPQDGAVFFLPIISTTYYGSILDMDAYDNYKLYLHTQNVRWSIGYGRLYMRQWMDTLTHLPTDSLLSTLAATGFTGIVIDTNGYTEESLATVVQEIQKETGDYGVAPSSISSQDSRYIFFDISEYTKNYCEANPDASSDVLQQINKDVTYSFGEGAYSEESSADGKLRWRWLQDQSEINIVNNSDEVVTTTLRMTLYTYTPGDHSVFVSCEDNSAVWTVNQNAEQYSITLNLAPGVNTIRLTTDAPAAEIENDPREMSLNISNFELIFDTPES